MFRVLPVCRVVTGLIWRAAAVVLYNTGADGMSTGIIVAVGLWVQYHLSRMRLYFETGVMIKKRGSFFNRKQVFVLKNICSLQTIVFADILPGVIALVYPGERFFIFGFSGRQIAVIEKLIKRNM